MITCGERSDKLSLYDVGTGAAVSRGFLGAEVTLLSVEYLAKEGVIGLYVRGDCSKQTVFHGLILRVRSQFLSLR